MWRPYPSPVDGLLSLFGGPAATAVSRLEAVDVIVAEVEDTSRQADERRTEEDVLPRNLAARRRLSQHLLCQSRLKLHH